MNAKPLGLKVLAVAVGTLTLAACGEEQATYTAADEARVKEMTMGQCAQAGGNDALCECIFDKMKVNLKKDDFSRWIQFGVVVLDGATSAAEMAEKAGISESELIDQSTRYAGEGTRAGMQCEAELAQ